jgi:hypothetical protein
LAFSHGISNWFWIGGENSAVDQMGEDILNNVEALVK